MATKKTNSEQVVWAAAGFTAGIAASFLYNKLFAKDTSKVPTEAPTASPTPQKQEVSSKIVNTGLKEYSVIYTDRAMNLLSAPFKKIMRDINNTMKQVYNAHSVALIPGSGSYGMESVARQYGTGKSVLIIRNGSSTHLPLPFCCLLALFLFAWLFSIVVVAVW